MHTDEEEIIKKWILDQYARGFPLSKENVQEIADQLLKERDKKPVGVKWVDNFIKHTPELRTRWSCPYDYQRAACEDLAIILRWFGLVEAFQ